jgi:DNA anti-recombination protein RmuC
MDKKVSLCSPVTLAIIINQILWATKTWQEYRNLDKVVLELRKFWEELIRFQERWVKVKESTLKNNNLLNEFDITVNKLIKQANNLKKQEQSNKILVNSSSEKLTEKETEN